jgi:hypothetical protein
LIDYARRHLSVLAGQLDGQAEIHLRQSDLNEEHWIGWLRDQGWLSQIDAVVSLQSIHDLGEADQQGAFFQQLASVLRPPAHFIYADLLLDPANPHPRRLPAYRHLALLREAGFHSSACTLQTGEFGAFVAVAAAEEGT